MILLALVAKVTSESKLHTCKLGVLFHCVFVKTKLLHLNFTAQCIFMLILFDVLHTCEQSQAEPVTYEGHYSVFS